MNRIVGLACIAVGTAAFVVAVVCFAEERWLYGAANLAMMVFNYCAASYNFTMHKRRKELDHGHWRADQEVHGNPAGGAGAGAGGTGLTFSGNTFINSRAAIVPNSGIYPSGTGGGSGGVTSMGVIGFFGLHAAGSDAQPRPPLENAGIVIGEVYGWRWWRVGMGISHPVLISVANHSFVWEPGAPAKGRPTEHNRKGVHAFKHCGDALVAGNELHGCASAFGRVRMWGTVIEHELGYRAEHALVVEIIAATLNHRSDEALRSALIKRYITDAKRTAA